MKCLKRWYLNNKNIPYIVFCHIEDYYIWYRHEIEISKKIRGDITSNFRIISEEYYSNCLIETLRAKIHNPQIKIYFCKPRIAENGRFQMFHFMWRDGVADYDFSDLNDEEMPWYKDFIFKGHLRKFKRGFAERYSTYRNSL